MRWWAARRHNDRTLGAAITEAAAEERAMWNEFHGPFNFERVVDGVQRAQDDGYSTEAITSWFAEAEEVDKRVITAAVRATSNDLDDNDMAALIDNWFDDAGPIRRGILFDMQKEFAQRLKVTPSPPGRARLRDRFRNRLGDRR